MRAVNRKSGIGNRNSAGALVPRTAARALFDAPFPIPDSPLAEQAHV